MINKHFSITQLIFFVLLFTLYTEGVTAQQEGQQTLFMFNALTINPAVSGSRDIPTLTLMTRNQWMGFKGAPVQQSLSFHSPLFSKRLGFGVALSNRHIGIFSSQTASMAWSYSPIRTKDFMLRIGLQGSAKRLAFDFETPDQAITIANERKLTTELNPRVLGNFGMGVFMLYKESYLGFSVPYYYSNILGVNSETPTTALGRPHYYFMAGLKFPLLDKVFWMPSGIVKKVANAPWGLEANSSLVYDDKITLGLSYRAGKSNLEDIGESVALLTFYQVSNNWGIGCAYDFNLSPLKKYTTGSFEAVMRYDLKHSAMRLSNPRVFF